MAEYISREAANRAVLRAYALHGKGMQYIETMCQLGLVSSADVVERKKGKWMHKEITADFHAIGQCSVCKERRRLDNFCSNCGADMREGEDGEIS